ncbi:MAG: hypothetical protein H6539_04720 [Bacteroidales bacterium]|nr:hypothetical protein [Bacteroidales bacterium]
MKANKFPLILFISSLVFLFPSLFSQNMPEVLAFRELELNPETNEIVFQNYYKKWSDKIKENSKGVSGWLMKADRGTRSSKYSFVWAFDFKTTRDYYFPNADGQNNPQWESVLQKFEITPLENPLIAQVVNYTDYLVLGYNSLINPQIGEVISVCYPEVIPGKESAFESFVINELNPAFQESLPGSFLYILKGDRGENAGKYISMWVFDTVDRRKVYFPQSRTVPSELFIKEFEQISPVMDKLKTFLKPGTMDNYTDYIVIY